MLLCVSFYNSLIVMYIYITSISPLFKISYLYISSSFFKISYLFHRPFSIYLLFIIFWFNICDSGGEVFLLKLTFLSCWVNNKMHVAIVEVDFAFLLGYKEVQIAICHTWRQWYCSIEICFGDIVMQGSLYPSALRQWHS